MKTILITGANRGIGLELTRAFLKKGDAVIAACRKPQAAEALAGVSEEHGERLSIQEMEVTNSQSIESVVESLKGEDAAIDLLINNAGIYPEDGDEKFSDLDPSLFRDALEVNVMGTILVTQAFLPMLRAADGAKIINMSSGAASITTKNDSRRYCYGTSKAALNMFTRTLAAELNKEGIIVVALSPGWVRTEMGGSDADISPEESAAAIVETSRRLSAEHSGLFLDRNGEMGTYAW